MDCPTCNGLIDISLINIERNAEEDGIEVGFHCPWCRNEHYAVLRSEDFALVD